MNTIELKVEMTRNGISIPDLARRIGVSPKTMYQKISGKVQFTRLEIVAICEELKIDNGRMLQVFFPELMKL